MALSTTELKIIDIVESINLDIFEQLNPHDGNFYNSSQHTEAPELEFVTNGINSFVRYMGEYIWDTVDLSFADEDDESDEDSKLSYKEQIIKRMKQVVLKLNSVNYENLNDAECL
jgi:hypothetical protein